MFKILLASAAIFAAPAMAQAIKPIDALNGIIRMETAWQFCGLPLNEKALMELSEIVSPHVKTSAQEFVEAIRRAATEKGINHVQNGTVALFCTEISAIYRR